MSEFDELIRELKRVQAAPEPMRKAIPTSAPLMPAPGPINLKALGKKLDLMAKSLGVPKVLPRRKPTQRETLLKSLVSSRQQIDAGVAAGALSPVQRVELEARLNTLVHDAAQAIRAGRL